ncbi:hypothetical protein EXIGLDRAFT_388715 [Exidia glandulosa HHB12029]|uniref:Uncharacterized protein n=1 Tax=Exidia glandulosa HHB12029 TaxID=1314781 RepID=A0A165BU73_EXIGL|nr:hypothetical protein EXIGLDRAFT_388715 [Exidia glandulosa HHB12029]
MRAVSPVNRSMPSYATRGAGAILSARPWTLPPALRRTCYGISFFPSGVLYSLAVRAGLCVACAPLMRMSNFGPRPLSRGAHVSPGWRGKLPPIPDFYASDLAVKCVVRCMDSGEWSFAAENCRGTPGFLHFFPRFYPLSYLQWSVHRICVWMPCERDGGAGDGTNECAGTVEH